MLELDNNHLKNYNMRSIIVNSEINGLYNVRTMDMFIAFQVDIDKAIEISDKFNNSNPLSELSIVNELLYISYKVNRDNGLSHNDLVSIGLANNTMLIKYVAENYTH